MLLVEQKLLLQRLPSFGQHTLVHQWETGRAFPVSLFRLDIHLLSMLLSHKI